MGEGGFLHVIPDAAAAVPEIGLDEFGHIANGQGDVTEALGPELPEDDLQDEFAVQGHQGLGDDLGHRGQADAFTAG